LEIKKKRALISVYDKTGVVEFATGLHKLGWEILSTGGTSKALKEAGIPVLSVSDVGQFPEILDGRVKTLNPRIFGGILARQNDPKHMKELDEQGIVPLGLIVVNLYPFEATIAKPDVTLAEAQEKIDIGGVSLLRAAAKNYPSVAVVCDPEDYSEVLSMLGKGEVSELMRLTLAAKAFRCTAHYDSAIFTYLQKVNEGADKKFPNVLFQEFEMQSTLRYGENPHQDAAIYASVPAESVSLRNARQIQGKELSYNNYVDLESALSCAREFDEVSAVILKHNNPCGLAVAKTLAEAYQQAHDCDALSAYGGIVGLNRFVDAETGKKLAEARFLECILAPGYAPEVLEMLAAKKNLRVLELPGMDKPRRQHALAFRGIVGGLLVQDDDISIPSYDLKVVTEKRPTEEDLRSLLFAFRVCKLVKSNAIVLVQGTHTVGIGAGQMSRVDSSELAAKKAGLKAQGAVLGSDAFFPFRDAVDAAAKAGARAIIQPGGSMRDEEVIQAANEHGIAMVFTGRRHFRH